SVLVVEFHSNRGPCTFSALHHTEVADAFHRIVQDRANQVVALTGAGGDSLLASLGRLSATSRIPVFGAKFTTKALSRARELAELYLKAPEVTRRNTREHFIQPLKERIVREVGYGLSLEGTSAVDLTKSRQAKSEPVARKGKSS